MPFKSKEQMYSYWLASSRALTPLQYARLLELAGSSAALFEDPDIIRGAHLRMKDEAKSKLLERRNTDLLESELDALSRRGISITTLCDADYPALLKEIADPPRLLYYKGSLERLADTRLAVVGTRFPSYHGECNTRSICQQLSAAGISIISGMARGIDTIAAKAALSGGTPTAAVLGCGIDMPYPKENSLLYEDICANGVVISEYPPGVPPLAENFPPRNRIISGMSQALFIAEGKLKSGGAISVRNAIEQNREVFALPGDISNPLSELPNSLIADGAIIVLGAKTFFENLNIGAAEKEITEKNDIELDFSEKQIYTLLKRGELTAEQLAERSGMDIATVNLTLTMLEIKQAVVRLPGNLYAIARRQQ